MHKFLTIRYLHKGAVCVGCSIACSATSSQFCIPIKRILKTRICSLLFGTTIKPSSYSRRRSRLWMRTELLKQYTNPSRIAVHYARTVHCILITDCRFYDVPHIFVQSVYVVFCSIRWYETKYSISAWNEVFEIYDRRDYTDNDGGLLNIIPNGVRITMLQRWIGGWREGWTEAWATAAVINGDYNPGGLSALPNGHHPS